MTFLGIGWLRGLAERNLDQSKAAFESWLMLTRKAAEGIEYQTYAVRECSMSIAQETISNAFEYAGRLAHVRQPQELAQVQSEFISRQAQAVGERTKAFAQSMAKANETAANTFREITQVSGKQAEAA